MTNDNDKQDKETAGQAVAAPAVPDAVLEFMETPWSDVEARYRELIDRQLTEENLVQWLKDWTKLANLIDETGSRLHVANTMDTTDEAAEKKYFAFLENIAQNARAQDQELKNKLLESGLSPEGFSIALRNIHAEAELFREENLPLFTQETNLGSQYDKIIGAQTVSWEGQEVTVSQLAPVFLDTDRKKREEAWRLGSTRRLADKQAINNLWGQFMALRAQIAKNAGLSDYRSFRWKQWMRFDYTPENCKSFHKAIEEVAVPASLRLLEKRKANLGLTSLRPWDLSVDTKGRPSLKPFASVKELIQTASTIFDQVDPDLARYFKTMCDEGLLDLDNRIGKAPGGYCTDFAVAGRPFIFMNSVGIHDDVQTLLHEAGHSFHVFEACSLPYHQQQDVGLEFAEVASMSMELITAPYLAKSRGGFYNEQDAARARIEHLENVIQFWPYMAVVDAFQHWVYENQTEATNPDACDAMWDQLWQRFMPGVDWSGLEDERKTGWHRKLHIHQLPFYYVEYGLAQLGAVQVWKRSLEDQKKAISDYRKALALGGTVTVPELFAAAGAKFAFDSETLSMAVGLAEQEIGKLEEIAK